MYLIDAHCHLHDREFFNAGQAEAMVKRALEKNVKKIVCIGTDHNDSLAARDFAGEHDEVFWTYGVHPNDAELLPETDDYEKLFGEIMKKKNQPVAIGEVGLDYHYDGYNREKQIKMFEKMLQLATDYNLPLSFHIREAFDDFFSVVANFPKVRGVVHSFSDSKKKLKRILEQTDFYVGVNGLATYSTLPTPPLEKILLETDAPFLAPVPMRGTTNEPSFIPEIALWLAKQLEIDFDTVCKVTTKNAETLFNLSK